MRRAASTPRWVWVVLTLLCAAAIVVAVLVVGPESAPAARSRTVTAERGVVQSTVSGSGTIQARQTNVNFATGGQLTSVKVKEGQHVVEGQALAGIKSQSAELSLEQAQAQLTAAQASLDSAEAQKVASASTSAQTSADKGTTGPQNQNQNQSQSQSQNQSSGVSAAQKQASVAQAQAQVDSAEAAVENAQQGVSDTTLTAPVSGTVASVNAGVGDFVSGGGNSNSSQQTSNSSSSSNSNSSSQTNSNSSSGSGSAFIVIVDMNHLELVVPFSESDIHKVKLHQPATVSVNALPDEQLAATVTSIDTLPTTNNSVTSYNVTFRIDQHASGIKPGMSASATVVVQRVEDAVNVITAAISRGGGGSSVTVVKDGKAARQTVTTGITGDTTTQVLSGLNAGDEVQVPIVTSGAVAGGSNTGRFGAGGAGALGGALGGAGGGPQIFRGGGGGGGGFARGGGGGGP